MLEFYKKGHKTVRQSQFWHYSGACHYHSKIGLIEICKFC